MFEDLKKNIDLSKKIILDLRSIHEGMEVQPESQGLYSSSANSLFQQLKILNNALPELLKEGSPIQKFVKTPKVKETKAKKAIKKVVSPIPTNTVKMSYTSPVTKEKHFITINKKDKKDFIEKLKISEVGLQNLKKLKDKKSENTVRKPSSYARISNKFFRGFSEKISPGFTGLKTDLKKANIRFLLTTYISMMLMSIVLAFFASIVIYVTLIILNPSLATYFWIIILIPVAAFASFYMYPASEAGSIQKRITQEMPFATIHMAAIAGSDITPFKIFRIISESPEYPSVGKEIRKIIAQIEIYGYDMVTSLKDVASRTPNKKLAELFSGIATNISTGGALKNYLNKKSENFLLDYKLERQKYIDLAGTFMDVYISILIAAPLVLMMMFIVMNVAGLGMAGIGIQTLLLLSVVAVALINVIFIFVLNLKQPKI